MQRLEAQFRVGVERSRLATEQTWGFSPVLHSLLQTLCHSLFLALVSHSIGAPDISLFCALALLFNSKRIHLRNTPLKFFYSKSGCLVRMKKKIFRNLFLFGILPIFEADFKVWTPNYMFIFKKLFSLC